MTIRGTPMSRTYTTLKETYANHPSNEKCLLAETLKTFKQKFFLHFN